MIHIKNKIKLFTIILINFCIGIWIPYYSGFSNRGIILFILLITSIIYYWIITIPQYINIGIAFTTGLLIDCICNIIIGANALIFVILTLYLNKINFEKFNFWNIVWKLNMVLVLHQILIIFIFLSLGTSFKISDIVVDILFEFFIIPILVLLFEKIGHKLIH